MRIGSAVVCVALGKKRWRSLPCLDGEPQLPTRAILAFFHVRFSLLRRQGLDGFRLVTPQVDPAIINPAQLFPGVKRRERQDMPPSSLAASELPISRIA